MVALCGIDCIDAVKIHSLFFMKSNMKINPGFSVRPVKCRKYPQFNSDLTHFQQQKSLCQEVPLPKVTGVLEWVHTQHKTPPFKPQNTNLPETDHGPPKKCFFMELPSHPSLWDRPRNCYVSGDDRIGLPRVYLYTIESSDINRNHIPFLISPLPGATIKSLHKSRPFCHSCWAEVWLSKNLRAAWGNHATKKSIKKCFIQIFHPNQQTAGGFFWCSKELQFFPKHKT